MNIFFVHSAFAKGKIKNRISASVGIFSQKGLPGISLERLLTKNQSLELSIGANLFAGGISTLQYNLNIEGGIKRCFFYIFECDTALKLGIGMSRFPSWTSDFDSGAYKVPVFYAGVLAIEVVDEFSNGLFYSMGANYRFNFKSIEPVLKQGSSDQTELELIQAMYSDSAGFALNFGWAF